MINSTSTCTGTQDPVTGAIALNCSALYGESTSTDQTFINGFTAGEIVEITIAFMILVVLSAIAFHLFFRKIKIKNQ